MRLSQFFVVLAATFLVSSGALADTTTDSVIKIDSYVRGSKPKPAPTHRALRTYNTDVKDAFEDDDEEERGIKDIPLEQLHSLGRKVGVNADDVLADAAKAMSTMTKWQVKNWIDGLNNLKKTYKKVKPSRISNY